MKEVWKPVMIEHTLTLDGLPRYEVSDKGNVRLADEWSDFYGRLLRQHILWGEPCVWLNNGSGKGVGRIHRVSELMALAFSKPDGRKKTSSYSGKSQDKATTGGRSAYNSALEGATKSAAGGTTRPVDTHMGKPEDAVKKAVGSTTKMSDMRDVQSAVRPRDTEPKAVSAADGVRKTRPDVEVSAPVVRDVKPAVDGSASVVREAVVCGSASVVRETTVGGAASVVRETVSAVQETSHVKREAKSAVESATSVVQDTAPVVQEARTCEQNAVQGVVKFTTDVPQPSASREPVVPAIQKPSVVNEQDDSNERLSATAKVLQGMQSDVRAPLRSTKVVMRDVKQVKKHTSSGTVDLSGGPRFFRRGRVLPVREQEQVALNAEHTETTEPEKPGVEPSETAEKVSSRVGRTGRKKSVRQLDMAGNQIGVFASGVAAAAASGVPQSSISACCRGKVKSAGGYRWEFEEV